MPSGGLGIIPFPHMAARVEHSFPCGTRASDRLAAYLSRGVGAVGPLATDRRRGHQVSRNSDRRALVRPSSRDYADIPREK